MGGSHGLLAGGWTWLCLGSFIIKGNFFFPAFTTEDERDGASTASPLQAFPECSPGDLGTRLSPQGLPQVVLWLTHRRELDKQQGRARKLACGLG